MPRGNYGRPYPCDTTTDGLARRARDEPQIRPHRRHERSDNRASDAPVVRVRSGHDHDAGIRRGFVNAGCGKRRALSKKPVNRGYNLRCNRPNLWSSGGRSVGEVAGGSGIASPRHRDSRQKGECQKRSFHILLDGRQPRLLPIRCGSLQIRPARQVNAGVLGGACEWPGAHLRVDPAPLPGSSLPEPCNP